MKIYAHRGRLDGPSTSDNRPDAIRACAEAGIGVELDAWGVDGELWLGHDGPAWRYDEVADVPDVIWHAKNMSAVAILRRRRCTFFCLERDTFALCSDGLVWANYNCDPTPFSIVCAPELVGATEPIEQFCRRVTGAYGVCTDYPLRVRELVNEQRRQRPWINHSGQPTN